MPPTQEPPPRLRGEARNAQIREGLEPLAPGERPGAVTAAVVLALLYTLGSVIAALLVDYHGDKSKAITAQVFGTAILVICAAGMWRAKYWAVLGFQALLALQIFASLIALLGVGDVLSALGLVAIVAILSTMFWKLVRAMARLQMPERPAHR
jgi:hypothetical protein